MEENFITYNQALALKELGFDEKCFCYFDDDKELRTCVGLNNWNNHSGFPYFVSAPLKQQALRWFRDKYHLYYIIHHFEHKKGTSEEFLSEISGKLLLGNDDVSKFSNHNTYEEAESACIDKLISIIKEKKS
jgi:hypothetical protein